MKKEEKEITNETITLLKSFTCNKLNKNLIWNVLEVLRNECPEHGDRAVEAFDKLWFKMTMICNREDK